MASIDEMKEKARAEGVSVQLVLKEQVHWLILDYLFKKGAFSHLVFQGGTALRMVYQGVRYSEDLDFVLRKKEDAFWKSLPEILEGLPSYMEKLLIFSKGVELKIQKQTPTFQRFVLTLKVEGLPMKDRTQLEVANVPSYANESLIVRAGEMMVNPAICVETPKEILWDKLAAFGSREYVKGRDIWDIDFLLGSMKLSIDTQAGEMVIKKVRDYRLDFAVFIEGFKKNLGALQNKGEIILKTEMSRFLPIAYQRHFHDKYREISTGVFQALNKFYEEIREYET